MILPDFKHHLRRIAYPAEIVSGEPTLLNRPVTGRCEGVVINDSSSMELTP